MYRMRLDHSDVLNCGHPRTQVRGGVVVITARGGEKSWSCPRNPGKSDTQTQQSRRTSVHITDGEFHPNCHRRSQSRRMMEGGRIRGRFTKVEMRSNLHYPGLYVTLSALYPKIHTLCRIDPRHPAYAF